MPLLLQVKDIIQSYKISQLVSQYVEGTRQWLYDEINDWLTVATACEGDGKSSRMFLLLAGPGMGKSVFSAVMHTHLMVRPESKRHVKMVGWAGDLGVRLDSADVAYCVPDRSSTSSKSASNAPRPGPWS